MATKKKTGKSNYKIPYSGNERRTVQRIIRASVKNNESPQAIYEKLQSRGLGYRKQNVLADVRLKRATVNAKTPQARRNSEKWFLDVFEPFRKQNKVNSNQAKKLWNKAVDESYKTRTDAKLGTALRDLYITKFGRSPRGLIQKRID